MSLLKISPFNSMNIFSAFLLCALVTGCSFSSSTDEMNATEEVSTNTTMITEPETTTQQMRTENELDLALKDIATEDIEVNHISISELYTESVTKDETIEDMGESTVIRIKKVETFAKNETNTIPLSRTLSIIDDAIEQLKNAENSDFAQDTELEEMVDLEEMTKTDEKEVVIAVKKVEEEIRDIPKTIIAPTPVLNDIIAVENVTEIVEPIEVTEQKSIITTVSAPTEKTNDVSFLSKVKPYNKEYNATPQTLKEMNDRLLKASQSSFSNRENIASEDVGRYLVKNDVKKEIINKTMTVKSNVKKPKIVSFQAENHVIYFDYKKTSLSNSAMTRMFKIAQIMKKTRKSHIDIIGYTDSVGSQKYNQKLAEKRTGNTVEFLKQLGINENRITVKSHGEQGQSITTGDNVKEAQNRRVEMRITAIAR